MASNLRVDNILPSNGTHVAIGTAGGTVNFIGDTTITNAPNSTTTLSGNLSVAGNLGIGGTLTYEDVTNIDAVGLITARSGIRIGAGTTIGPVSGIITYFGDGSQLSGINAANISQGDTKAEVIDTGSNGRFVVEVDGTQKLRVDDDYVFINTNTVGSAYASNLVINDTSNCGITIRSGNGNGQYGSIYFADGTSGDARYAGKVEYNQYYDYLTLASGADSRITFYGGGGSYPAGSIGLSTATGATTGSALSPLNSNSLGKIGQVISSRGSAGPAVWLGGTQRTLEVVSSPCDGSVINSSRGDVTFGNVTAKQNLTTSFVDITGSTISYCPPVGTKQVIYEFNFQMSRLDATVISHYQLYLDSDEVTKARSEMAGEDLCARTSFKWIFNIGGSADTTVGRVASWNTHKTMKWQAEDYGSSYDVQLHSTNWWNGGGTDQFSMPTLTITAIGA